LHSTLVGATALVLGAPLRLWGAQIALSPARDLASDSTAAARAGVPLIVMVSLPGCPHCEVVRRSHLLPLLADAVSGKPPLIRQVEMNGADRLKDFTGQTMTHAEFASRFKIKIAPVVMFFGAKGEILGEPLVGSMIPDFYGAYFDTALGEARAKVSATRR
jgi:thioredoxin-related protein